MYALPIDDLKFGFKNNEYLMLVFNEIDYILSFDFDTVNSYNILKEIVELSFDCYKISDEPDENNKLFSNWLYLKNIGGAISSNLDNECLLARDDLIPDSLLYIVQNNLKTDNVPIINSLSSIPFPWTDSFRNMGYWDFNPKFIKNGSFINQRCLSEAGDNLSRILYGIVGNPEDKRKFVNLLNYLLPYIEDVDVTSSFDGRFLFNTILTCHFRPLWFLMVHSILLH